jgi:predicted TIM-barrel enzyme
MAREVLKSEAQESLPFRSKLTDRLEILGKYMVRHALHFDKKSSA